MTIEHFNDNFLRASPADPRRRLRRWVPDGCFL